ncbi:biopolymer transporter ExbD [Massilia arenosa]|uniref:Biopolymer transporter ExbD n=1 Tax=Zemynaea arenosa TaxID=2561931 RepID=A0A4Y9SLZ0_9BURK|nr:biopolymer transporter ExbD [Massilia arenosa]TFW27692.1 biopolymer transporter ExbD [Massilia arenosa]
MAFGSFNPSRPHQMMSDINVTPMVDVMLVLLVIFILTAPMFTHAIRLDLPQAQAAVAPPHGQPVTVSLDAAGQIYWNDERVDAAGFEARLAEAAALPEPPELQLRADRATRYEAVAEVMAAAQAHGLTRLGFVTDPRKKTP